MLKQMASPAPRAIFSHLVNAGCEEAFYMTSEETKDYGEFFTLAVAHIRDLLSSKFGRLDNLRKALGEDPWPFIHDTMRPTFKNLRVPIRLDLAVREGGKVLVGANAEDLSTPCEMSRLTAAWSEVLRADEYSVYFYESKISWEVARYYSMNPGRRNEAVYVVYDYYNHKSVARAEPLMKVLESSVPHKSSLRPADKTSGYMIARNGLLAKVEPWVDLMSQEGVAGSSWRTAFKDGGTMTLTPSWTAAVSELPYPPAVPGETIIHAWVDLDNPSYSSLICCSREPGPGEIRRMYPVVVTS